VFILTHNFSLFPLILVLLGRYKEEYFGFIYTKAFFLQEIESVSSEGILAETTGEPSWSTGGMVA
jgi:hypothetical protein